MCASASNRSNVYGRYSKGTHQPAQPPIIPQSSLLFAEGDECTLAGGVAVIGVYVHAKRALRVENFPCATSISPPSKSGTDRPTSISSVSVGLDSRRVRRGHLPWQRRRFSVLRLIYFIFDRARVSQLVETHGFLYGAPLRTPSECGIGSFR